MKILAILLSLSLALVVNGKHFELKKKFIHYVEDNICNGNDENWEDAMFCINMFSQKAKATLMEISKTQTFEDALIRMCKDTTISQEIVKKFATADQELNLDEAFWKRLEVCITY